MSLIYLSGNCVMNPEGNTSKLNEFFQTLQGFYFATGPQIKTKLLLPRIRFVITPSDEVKIMAYLLNESNHLSLPIQDRHSFDIENLRPSHNPSRQYPSQFSWEFVPLNYSRQKGKLELTRYDEDDYSLKSQKVSLEKITRHKAVICKLKVTDELIDEMYGR